MACCAVSLPVLHRLPALVVHVGGDRLHDHDGQEQGQPQEQLVGWRVLRSERLPQKVQNHGNAQEGSDRHDRRGQQRHQRQQNHDLHRHAEAPVLSRRDAEQRERVGAGRRRRQRRRSERQPAGRPHRAISRGPSNSRHGKLSISAQPDGDDATSKPRLAHADQVDRVLRPQRQALHAFQLAAARPSERQYAGKPPPPQKPKHGAQQAQNSRHRRRFLSSRPCRSAPYDSSRKSVMRTPSTLSITTISPDPQSTPPM